MVRIAKLAVLLLAVSALVACSGSSSTSSKGGTSYTVSGTVEDADGNPLEGVVVSFGASGTAVSDVDGKWSKSGLGRSVTIQAAKDGYVFTPSKLTVSGARDNVRFVGTVDPATLDAEVIVAEALVDPNPAWAKSMYHDRVRLSLTNIGGPGHFKVQFWGRRPNVINPPMELFGETEVYDISAGWSDVAAWDVDVFSTSLTRTYIEEVVVLTRNPGELAYRETDRVSPTIDTNL